MACTRLRIAVAAHDPQRADRFDVTVTGLRRPGGGPVERGAGRGFGVDRVGLALPAAVLTVGSVDLDDVDAVGRGGNGSGLHPTIRSLRPRPGSGRRDRSARRAVHGCRPRSSRNSRWRAVDPAGSSDGGDVDVAVGVDTADHAGGRICHGGHVSSFGSGTCPPVRADRTRLRPQARLLSGHVAHRWVRSVRIRLRLPAAVDDSRERHQGRSRQRVTPRRGARPIQPHARRPRRDPTGTAKRSPHRRSRVGHHGRLRYAVRQKKSRAHIKYRVSSVVRSAHSARRATCEAAW